jgi:hypothetical protein
MKKMKEVELDVDGNVLDDHIDDEIIKNDIDDDVAMPNPFNIDSKPILNQMIHIWSWTKKKINDIELLKCRSGYVIIYFL